jgi:hypothetical protein
MCISKILFYVYRWSQNKSLISSYGKDKDYPEKSYTAMFWNLNYNQWNAYTRGAQVVGNKITLRLMEIFQT